jgi:hypothetical protein
MQYVLLIYQGTTPLPNTAAWSSLSEDEQQAIYADYAAISKMPNVKPGLPLGLPEAAKTVRVENGTLTENDGPFVGSEGAVAGYFVVDVDDVDAAMEIAARVPAARHGGAIEVRPVGTYW